MPTHVIKDVDLRDDIQRRLLELMSDDGKWKTKDLRESEPMQEFTARDIRTIIYALRDLGLIRNASLFY